MTGLLFLAAVLALALLRVSARIHRAQVDVRAAERARLLRAAEVAVASAGVRCWNAHDAPRPRRHRSPDFQVLTVDRYAPAPRVLDLYP